MEVRITRLGNRAVEVTPVGRLDETTLAELRPHLLDCSNSVILDLSEVDRIDAAVMALVMLARIEIEAAGGALVVQAPAPRVGRILDRAGLPRFVTVAQRRIDALRALRRPGAIAA